MRFDWAMFAGGSLAQSAAISSSFLRRNLFPWTVRPGQAGWTASPSQPWLSSLPRYSTGIPLVEFILSLAKGSGTRRKQLGSLFNMIILHHLIR